MDLNLGVGAVEVIFDGSLRQKKLPGDLSVGHTGCGKIQDLGLPVGNLVSQGIGHVLCGRVQHDVSRFSTEHQAATAAGLDSSGHLVDAQLAMDQIAPRTGVECPADTARVTIRGEHDDRCVTGKLGKDIKSAAPGRHRDVKQDDVGGMCLTRLERGKSVVRFDDLINGINTVEYRAESESDDDIIVDNHHLHMIFSLFVVL